MKIETEWFNWDCSLKDCEFESCLEGDEYRLIDYSRWEEDVIKKMKEIEAIKLSIKEGR